MKYPWIYALLVATTVSLTSDVPPSSAQSSMSDSVQVIEVTASKYEFNPSPIRVKQGTKVQLKITATDHVHGFRISPFADGSEAKGSQGLVFSSLPDCVKIEKAQTEIVEFMARTPGTYPFKCCVHCGWRHRSMKGDLIVEP